MAENSVRAATGTRYLLYSREEATEKSQVGQENTDTEDAAASEEPVSFARKSSRYGGKRHLGLSDFFQVKENGEKQENPVCVVLEDPEDRDVIDSGGEHEED